MDTQIVTIYCLCDDLLKKMHHVDDKQCQMTDAEVLTTAIVATLYFGGNLERARALLGEPRYIPGMLSRSRLNRRLHRVKRFFLTLFAVLGERWKTLNEQAIYLLDTFPLPACEHYRVFRARLYPDMAFRGFTASKKAFFHGLKLHLMVTATGQPVEFFLTPGSCGDIKGLQWFDFDLPVGSEIYADKAYNDYTVEDELAELGLSFKPIRKRNSKRPEPAWMTHWQTVHRKVIETAGSLIHRLMPRRIHAVTAAGFEMKIVLFVLALSLHHWLKVAT